MKGNLYNLGQIVYLVTDSEQLPRMVTCIKFSLDGGIMYTLTNGTQDTDHYQSEIMQERNMEIFLGLKTEHN